jgi:hypothetical protein
MAGDMLTVSVEKDLPPPPPTSTPVPALIPTPTIQSAAGTGESSICAAGQATYQFHNFLGGAVNGTFTRQGDDKKESFTMPPDADQTLCLDPGRWTYTIASPGWQSLTDGFEAAVGQTTQFPVSGMCETTPLIKVDRSGVSITIGEVTICTIQKPLS